MEDLYNDYQHLLISIAYRMLGSLADAEDIVQDVFVDAEPHGLAHIENRKAYLCRSVTNRCINYLKSARKRREVYVGTWLPEPLVTTSEGDPMDTVVKQESITYALLVTLEQLNPAERAVFILRETLHYTYKEIAEVLDRTEGGCRKLCSRAKAKLAVPWEQPSSALSPRTEQEEKFVELFLHAVSSGRFDECLSMLTREAILYTDGGGKVRCALRPILGTQRIQALWSGIAPRGYFEGHMLPVYVNGRRGFVLVRAGRPVMAVSMQWTPEQDRISKLFIVSNPDKLHRIRLS
ncbi:RNA polymerase sigma factor SigJ [Paenibacillus sp. FJAT-26967]|uniref:RNA polymerase sigma factor SigJ n=1 Tax=Paenibacillus sp. FJAT-26967 TaxID=1729690 RepID=UPI000B09AF54|nr:RNA polymerase sigma factor SigJ [Paenibacillus sp. FJAT-26967]